MQKTRGSGCPQRSPLAGIVYFHARSRCGPERPKSRRKRPLPRRCRGSANNGPPPLGGLSYSCRASLRTYVINVRACKIRGRPEFRIVRRLVRSSVRRLVRRLASRLVRRLARRLVSKLASNQSTNHAIKQLSKQATVAHTEEEKFWGCTY